MVGANCVTKILLRKNVSTHIWQPRTSRVGCGCGLCCGAFSQEQAVSELALNHYIRLTHTGIYCCLMLTPCREQTSAVFAQWSWPSVWTGYAHIWGGLLAPAIDSCRLTTTDWHQATGLSRKIGVRKQQCESFFHHVGTTSHNNNECFRLYGNLQ